MLILSKAPPSLNNAFVNSKAGGRYRSKRYDDWRALAKAELMTQRAMGCVTGPYALDIQLGAKLSRADIDNLIKPIADILGEMGFTPDDSKMAHVSITKRPDLDKIIINLSEVRPCLDKKPTAIN